MDVAVSQLRAHLREWIDRARAGEPVVLTERGIPIARLVPVDHVPLLERLEAEGAVGRPERPSRPTVTGRTRVRASASVSDIVSEQRGR